MSNTAKNEYNPDYAVSPGEYLDEVLEAREIKRADFARSCGIELELVDQIICEEAPVTPELAGAFQRVLGVNASIWTSLEEGYRQFVGGE